ncbi:MAG: hypothetical protein HY866_15885, partial [Chloroflexi bacterium]|nr:hypothetical protein [Chloroflexota bacterium]
MNSRVQTVDEGRPDHQTVPTSSLPSTLLAAQSRPRTRWNLLLAPAVGIILLLIWEGVARSGWYASFIVPSPVRVADRWWALAADGSLLRHTAVTLREVLTGMMVGVLAAFWLGYAIAKSRTAAYALTPYLVALQAVPIVAIAPLLI